MNKVKSKENFFNKFPGQFWLVVIFEFFERGSYYGMMSILSVYLTNDLHFAKESVGLIKGVIQPLLYFLPIISGALADRFGYRKTLMVAFSLLGMGYFLTAQATEYALVFGALVVMGFGAGTFKPIISGTIARVTDESNSTLGFGIFYWSINLGAFLFPLILVPYLKQINQSYVIIAAAIGTGILILPTFFFYKEPVKQDNSKSRTNLIQTLADAFEIIYSPIVLLYHAMKTSVVKRTVWGLLIVFSLIFSTSKYLSSPEASEKYPNIGIKLGEKMLIFSVERNMSIRENYEFNFIPEDTTRFFLKIYKPSKLDELSKPLLNELHKFADFQPVTVEQLNEYIRLSDKKISIDLFEGNGDEPFQYNLHKKSDLNFSLTLNNLSDYEKNRDSIIATVGSMPELSGISQSNLDELVEKGRGRSFFLLYVTLIIVIGLGVIGYSNYKNRQTQNVKPNFTFPTLILFAAGLSIWFLPGVTILGKIISYVIFMTLTSLFIINKSDHVKFTDHAKFLLMILLYSGFWILYFQMFDSVLWYVQAYVDAESLNMAVNGFLGIFGIHMNWFFDVEHVTVVNAGTIILLQLIISSIVKNTKALPTMIVGITIATAGMAILAISANIWVFMIGIILFSVGEMTTHPKFISYIGIIAPEDKKAMYMGYLFLYGVFGSSIGGILGAKLYVHFVDNLNQPRTLWLVFSMIGVATIISLLLYNKFLAPKTKK